MKKDNYHGNRGPGRRVYGEGSRGNAPRVGRVADDVPRAQRVTGEGRPFPREERPNRGERTPGRPNRPERPGRPARSGRPDRGERTPIHHANPPRCGEDRPYPREGRPGRERTQFHRGDAWRSESGPKRPAPYDYEPPEIPEELAAEFTDVPADERLLAGRNPIREALKAGRPVEKLLVAEGDLSGSAREIIRMARDAGALIQTVDRARLDQICPAHQGMLAYVAAVHYTPLEDILAAAREKGEDAFIVALDGVTDPHNLGAVIRSAECAGAHGVVIPERRAAGLTPAAAKAAAGALDHLPVARVKNLNRALDEMKAAGLWIVGADMDGEDAFTADLTGPIALVVGSEGEGISRMALERCDRKVSLPVKGHIDSLNASVAAGVLMYEIVRQRAK